MHVLLKLATSTIAAALAACAAPPPGSASVRPVPAVPTADEPVALAVAASPASVSRGEATTLWVILALAPTWHVYPPGAETGMPTRVAVADEPGVVAGEWAFPAAHPLPGDPTLAYSGDIAISCPLRVAKDAPVGRHRLRITIGYMACDPFRCNPPAEHVLEAELEVR